MRALLAKLILHTTARLPLPVAHLLGVVIGTGLILIPNRTRRIATINIRLCFPELSLSQQKRLVRQSLIEMAKTFTESGILWLGNSKRLEKMIKSVEGEEHIKRALEGGHGAIFISPHIGNWEVIGLYCSPRYPMISLYRPPRMKALDALIRRGRQRNGSKLAPITAQGIRALMQMLKSNGTTGILPDQDPRDHGGHFAPFFGIQANTMTLLSRLAHKSRAPTILTYAERLSWGRGFRLHFIPGPEVINGRDIDASVTAINALVEQAVRHLPAQYQWGYKRFKTRPEGEQPIY
ncbi:MAG TPA: lipid A biosynthesis acyltransferase [Candidatus Tenderia sp.]|nr:lipid A biosynthesis acyltransferase [Candidatus Tenderia sp.]